MGSLRGRARTVRLAGVAAVLFGLVPVGAVRAADPVSFGAPTADSSFGKFIEFKQPVVLARAPQRVEVLLSAPGDVGPNVIPQPGTAAGSSDLDYRIDLADDHIVPNTTFTARWRITDDAGKVWVGPPVARTYGDDRFDWKTLNGDVVHLHWVEGDAAFGRRALKIGEDAVAETARLLGVTESAPIDIFVYAEQQAFYDALGPATRENVGGQAHPDIRTLFALITPRDIDASWVESVVPHELTHVVFASAVDNPYHDPPRWLNEGLAVYLSDGYDETSRQDVAQATANGTIIPLDGLAGAFPTTQDRFFLAYAESVSAVERIVRVNGRDALVKLIRSYHEGVSDDDAFRAAIGKDVAGFQAEWLAELGAKPPTKLGPRPAPAGPLPQGWGAPQPDPSFEVVGSIPPVPDAPAPVPHVPDQSIAFFTGPLVAIGLVLVVVVIAVGSRRLRAPTDSARWAETGDNRLFGRPSSVEPPADPVAEPATPSRLWSATDWSLPHDPDGSVAPGEPPLDAAPPDELAPDVAIESGDGGGSDDSSSSE